VIGVILFGQNHLYVKILFKQGFRFSEVFQKILQVRKVGSLPAVRTTCHTVRTPDRPSIIRPDDVGFRSDPSLYKEAYVPAYIRPDDFH
jgi:hypothetical protein